LAEAWAATWNLEYRRAGNAGGGWPGSFLDLAAGVDFLRTIVRANQLGLNRVVGRRTTRALDRRPAETAPVESSFRI